MGGFIGLVITMAANPILQHMGVLSTWRPDMGFIDTTFVNNLDKNGDGKLEFDDSIESIGAVPTRKRAISSDGVKSRSKSKGDCAPNQPQIGFFILS